MSEEGVATHRVSRLALWISPLIALMFLLLADLAPGNPTVTRTAAVALLMALWWITQALPLAITALMPLVLFPLLGIMSAKDTAAQYMNDIIFLFIGGFLVALAMQHWNLHRRIALRVILWFGVRPARLLLGFMAAAFFLSMWMSNTATTMMMFPIVMSLLTSLEARDARPGVRHFGVALLLGIAYASSIGGTATLIGTPPNLSFVRIFHLTFPNAPEISFAQWMMFATPLALLLLGCCWAVLAWLFCRGQQVSLEAGSMRDEYDALGTPSFEQRVIFAVFSALSLLWITRVDIPIGSWTLPGWSNLAGNPAFISDGTVAIAMALLLFFIPSRQQPARKILEWDVARQLPWDIVLLFGGGFALAAGIASSGLAAWVGVQLQGLSGVHPILLVLVTTALVSGLTALTSNTVTTEMLLPVMASLSIAVGLHPLYLMVTTTLACSFDFMLPVGTPPNAIVFGSGRLRVVDMVKAGFLLNIAGVLLLTLFIFTLGPAVFDLGAGLPDWAVLTPPAQSTR